MSWQKASSLFLIPAVVAALSGYATAQTPPPLTIGTESLIERELTGGQRHAYRLALEAEQYLRVIVDQRGIDVTASLSGPDGQKLAEVNNQTAEQGPELFSLVTGKAGDYRLEIWSQENSEVVGRYHLRIDELRAATPQDEKRLAAEKLFAEGERLRREGTPEALNQASEKYQAALQQWRDLNDHYGAAIVLHGLGQVQHRLGEQAKASDFYQQALMLFLTQVGNRGWGRIFSNFGTLHLLLGGRQQTLAYLTGALPLVRAMRNRSIEAFLTTGIAKAQADLGQQEAALAYYDQALLLFRAAGNRGGEAITLGETADADLSVEEKQKAIVYLSQALPILQMIGDHETAAYMQFAIGYLYTTTGDQQKALSSFEKALPPIQAAGNRQVEAYINQFIGDIYLSLGELQNAQDYYEKALALVRIVGDELGESALLGAFGQIHLLQGRKEQALAWDQQSLALAQKLGNQFREANILLHTGTVYLALDDKQKALEYFARAQQLWPSLAYRPGLAATLLSIGFTHNLLKQPDKALEYYDQALPVIREAGMRPLEAWALYGVALAERLRGNLSEARRQIEAAVNIIESLRTGIISQQLRTSWFASHRQYYEFYLDLLMQMQRQNPAGGFNAAALQISERARARTLLDLLAEARADIRQGIAPELLQRERALQQQLNAKEQHRMQLFRLKNNQQQLAALDKEIRTLSTQYQDAQAQIRADSPRYAALTQPQPLSVKEIQQLLDPDTLLLEYAFAGQATYLWAVTPDSLAGFALPARAEIETLARRYYELLATRSQEAAQPATELSQMLLGPVAPLLQKKRLLIVTDGALQYLPFAALPDPVAGGQSPVIGEERHQPPASGPQPLIAGHEIVSLPSASILALLRAESAGRQPAPKSLAILADPVFAPDDARVQRALAQTADEVPGEKNETRTNEQERLLRSALEAGVVEASVNIPRLPGTRREAAGISALLPETERRTALDFEASLATVTSNELSQYRILHFATHGLLNSAHPELSGIVLSLVDQTGKPQNGFLRLHEIYNLNLPADLVVLSACQTGLGKEIRGEGLVGLTRGFMYAGAPRVVASLWQVDDRATSELMKRFYQGMLKDGLRPAAALRAAQVAMWQQQRWQSPYYWAAFVLQGEWR